jgi:uncharacterized protein (DUF1330 family)
MPAYFVVELEIANQEAMEPYRAAVPAMIAQYGGRFLTRGGATELIEGRTGTEAHRYRRIRRQSGVQALVRFPRIPENPARPARQLDRPRLCRRGIILS